MIGHVSCIEHQTTIGVPLLSSCQGDLAVLHHLVTTIHPADNAYCFCRVCFLHHLGNNVVWYWYGIKKGLF